MFCARTFILHFPLQKHKKKYHSIYVIRAIFAIKCKNAVCWPLVRLENCHIKVELFKMNFFVYIFFNFLVYVGATPPWLRDDNDDDDNDDNKVCLTLSFRDLICNSPYCLPCSSYDISWEDLVLHQLIISFLIFFLVVITCLLDIVLIL